MSQSSIDESLAADAAALLSSPFRSPSLPAAHACSPLPLSLLGSPGLLGLSGGGGVGGGGGVSRSTISSPARSPLLGSGVSSASHAGALSPGPVQWGSPALFPSALPSAHAPSSSASSVAIPAASGQAFAESNQSLFPHFGLEAAAASWFPASPGGSLFGSGGGDNGSVGERRSVASGVDSEAFAIMQQAAFDPTTAVFDEADDEFREVPPPAAPAPAIPSAAAQQQPYFAPPPARSAPVMPDPYASVGLAAAAAAAAAANAAAAASAVVPPSMPPFAFPAPMLGGGLLSVDPLELARAVSMSMSMSQRAGAGAEEENPLESDVAQWEEQDGDAEDEPTSNAYSTQREEDEDIEPDGVSKKRKLAAFRSTPVREPLPPESIPPKARVCELGLLRKQVTGRACWTAYEKQSATDRSCLALLCSSHADESNRTPGQGRYSQLVPRSQLLQVSLGIERKALMKLLALLQAQLDIGPVLLLRIRRAVPGRAKTGPEHCTLLLFASEGARALTEAHPSIAVHLAPPQQRIDFSSPLVAFSCDFTRRCVWLVKNELCVGGQYMQPPEAGMLQHTNAHATPAAAASVAVSEALQTPPSPAGSVAHSLSTHKLQDGADLSARSRSIAASSSSAASTAASTQLPLFSALSLHGPPGLEDATFVRVIRGLKSSHRIQHVSEGEDPYSHLALAFNDLEREAVARFRRFPGREAVFRDEEVVDLYITRSTFVNHALSVLLDCEWGSEKDREEEQARWAPLLQSLLHIISLPAVTGGGAATSLAQHLTFTQFFRLWAWLRPTEGWTRPEGGEWTEADLAPNLPSGRSRKAELVLGRVFALLAFLHRSIKFFTAYVRKPQRFVFATRAQLEADERFRVIPSPAASSASSAAAPAVDALEVDSPSSTDLDLLVCPQLRFCEGHVGHLTEAGQEPLYRDIVCSFTWRRADEERVHAMEHVPLLRYGPEGYFVFKPNNDPSLNLNWLSPVGGDESALHDLARFLLRNLLHQRQTKMEGSEQANEYGVASLSVSAASLCAPPSPAQH